MTDSHEVVVQVKNLSKNFKNIKAVDDLSFEVYRGEVLGFLGPNGAGKSTTIDLITTLLQPSSGEITYPGLGSPNQPKSIRHHIGIVPQELAIYGNLTVYDNLTYIGAMYGLHGHQLQERTKSLLAQFDLVDKVRVRARTLSGGLKRRLNFALSDVHQPELIVLDEPTVGLDPNARQLVWQIIDGFRQAGKTVLLTTHYMEEAEILCERIILINHGRIVAQGSPVELKTILMHEVVLNYQLSSLARPQLMELLRQRTGIRNVAAEGNNLRIVISRNESDAVKSWIAGSGLEISGLQTEDISLEDVFVHFTGRTLQETGSELSQG